MKNQLENLLEDNQDNIIEEVIKEALEYDNPKDFFEQLQQYWCVSWMVGSLIRYSDTHKFFEKHYEEIQEIRDELQESWVPVEIPTNTDLKNFLAWLSFEEVAYRVYNILEYDE